MPDTIQFGNGRQIINSYDAGGHKLTTQYYTPIVTQGNIHGSYTTANSVLRLDDYCGSYLYENGTSASVHPLTKILTPEGYIDMSTSGYPYCYYKQDHLGSNREVTSYAGTTGTVVQQTEYYPSGTAYVEGTGAGVQPFKFTGKELIIMHGLNWQDFGARWLDNVRMQWTTMDPLCEKYYAISPYTYCSDDPAKNIDPDGRDWYTSQNNKTVFWQKGNVNIDGYTQSETYTQRIDDHTTIEYNQNTPVTMSETVLQPKDFSSQMKADGSGKKEGEADNCFYQSGKMVEKSGAKSLDSPANGITDQKKELNYIEYQASQGKSTRLQVDRNGDGKGDHWVATSSVKTDLQTNTVSSVGFFDPATRFPDKGTNNSFNVGKDNSLTGIPSYNRKYRYHVVQTRKNKN